MKKEITIIAVSLVLILGVVFTLGGQSETQGEMISGVNRGNERHSTTTSEISASRISQLSSQAGGLGYVTFTQSNTVGWTIWNATTSNINLRTGNKATSTLILADFPASMAVGTYQFDSIATDGIIVDMKAGMGTSTITHW